ncbi:MAG: hypothetical protein KAR85_02865 [Methanosarcinales archaeon]|nr:hypothetical protein [Methanosarcinales archaeon]
MDDHNTTSKTWIHWVIYNTPANTTGLPGAVHKNKTLGDGSLQGTFWHREKWWEIRALIDCNPEGIFLIRWTDAYSLIFHMKP